MSTLRSRRPGPLHRDVPHSTARPDCLLPRRGETPGHFPRTHRHRHLRLHRAHGRHQLHRDVHQPSTLARPRRHRRLRRLPLDLLGRTLHGVAPIFRYIHAVQVVRVWHCQPRAGRRRRGEGKRGGHCGFYRRCGCQPASSSRRRRWLHRQERQRLGWTAGQSGQRSDLDRSGCRWKRATPESSTTHSSISHSPSSV